MKIEIPYDGYGHFNKRFGFDHIIKLYSGYGKKYKGEDLPVVLLHGVQMGKTVHYSESDNTLPVAFTYPDYRDDAFTLHTDKTIIPSCSPFLYGLELWKDAIKPASKRKGSLFFPMHTTKGARLPERDWFDMADSLVAMPDEFKPVEVCLFPEDDEAIFPLQDYAGLKLHMIADGDLYKKTYVRDMLSLMSNYECCFSDGVGSNLFYSIAMGIPYFVVGDIEPKFKYAVGNDASIDLSPTVHARKETVRPLFTEMKKEITQEQKDITNYYLGGDRKKSRADLLKELEYARMLYPDYAKAHGQELQ